MNCCGWRSWIRMTVTSAPPPSPTPESNFQKVKWSRQGYKEQSLFPPRCCYSIHQNLILTWSSRTFRPDCSLLTINHQNGPFIKWPPWSGPLVTHKCFSNIKSDIDGAPRPAAASLNRSLSDIHCHQGRNQHNYVSADEGFTGGWA